MEYAIEMLNITKEFPGIIANDNITLRVKKGEVHALLGENGAGKSTLMSVLFGLYQPESGTIKINEEVVKIHNPNDANAYGIGMVHQHFKLVECFTVLENIILGAETTAPFGKLKMKEARQKVIELSEKYGLAINPDALISDISVGMQQRVEILKMLYRQNDILIFDEPTAVLTPQEINELMKVMKGLTKEGKSIVFITHKLNEIKAIADQCTVLRKGKYVGTVDVSSTDKETLSEMMVGRKVEFVIEKSECKPTEVILELDKLSVDSKHGNKAAVKDVSFSVRKGEIVCVAGIEGNGQSELVYAITGLLKAQGSIKLSGKEIIHAPIRQRNNFGIAHIPEDRHRYGLILEYNLAENLALKKYFTPQFQQYGFLKNKEINEYGKKLIDKFDIRSSEGIKTVVRSMSGGNQQKAIIAREIDTGSDLLIAVQPTRGLDVGAIEYIHKQIIEQRNNDKAVLLISLELDEVMNLSDRILVMYEGEIVADVNPNEVTVQELGLYMSGSKRRVA